ncbi:MAG: glycosyltransferase family A protein [Bauldia sp.]
MTIETVVGRPVLTIAGETLDSLAGGAVIPPLVSVVVIAWNHERFVEAAIASIRGQDYAAIECVVVDNGSSDGTAAAIARAVGDDPRFTVVLRNENAGQLGAFIDVFDRLRGEFVTIVDSDDLIFSNAIATHVQVQLALPQKVAITSGAIIQIGGDGQAFHRHRPDVAPRSARSVFSEPAIRVASISDEQYDELSRRVTLVPAELPGWHWSPGSAILYRRATIAAILPRRQLTTRLYADGYLASLCHALHGSAAIHLPLSAWRTHGGNEMGAGITSTYNNAKPGLAAMKRALNGERLRRALADPKHTDALVPGRYWTFVDVAAGLFGWQQIDQNEVVPMFAASYPDLIELFGIPRTLMQIAKRVPLRSALRIVRDATGRAPSPAERAAILTAVAARKARDAATILAPRNWARARRLFAG